MPLLNTELRPRIGSAEPLLLPYRLARVPLTQARFVDRVLLKPQIDLKRYKVTAEIDWIEVVLTLRDKTQPVHVQDHLAPFLEGSVYVFGWRDGKKIEQYYTGKSFICRAQNPKSGDLMAAIDKLRDRWGLTAEPEVVGLEVSVDWRPRSQNPEERLRMVGLLHRHFLAPGILEKDERKQSKDRQPRSFIRFDPETKVNPVWVFDGNDYQAPRIDATYYAGADYDDVMWRIMDKTSDRRTGTDAVLLSPGECRARVEVRLHEKPLRGWGIVSLEDVRRFEFEKFRTPYFRFWMATIPMNWDASGADEGIRPEQGERTPLYLKNVLKAGVYAANRQDYREALAKREQNKRLPLKERVKEGGRSKNYRVGDNGFLVSFDWMNIQARDALRGIKF